MIDRPKKVIILGTAWPFRGGLAAYNERLAQEFVQQGIACEIVTFTTQYPSILFPGKTQYSEEPSAFKSITRKLSSVNPISWWTTARYINQVKPDLLITRFWIPFIGPSLGSVIRLLKKDIKVICLLDNVVPHEKRIGDQLFTRYFLAPINHYVAMSKSVQSDLFRFKKDTHCILNPHPVFDNFGTRVERGKACKELQLDPNSEYVLFFGFIRKYKGLDLAIKSFAQWKEKMPNVKFLVAGEFYGDKESYIKLAKDEGVEEQIVWHTNFIADSKVKFYFSACSLVLQPYYTATQSGVTQIAYQFEVPMIVTKVGGLPELVKHGQTGYLVNHEPTEIAKFVQQFYNSDRETFAVHLKKAKEQFSWNTLINNFIKLYQGTN